MFKTIFFHTIFLAVIAVSVFQIIQKHALFLPSDEFLSLTFIDEKKYDSITLALEPYRGIMLAANLLDNFNLYSIENSYIPKIDFMPDRITAKNPILTTADSCIKNLAIDFSELAKNFILIYSVRQPDKNIFTFSRKPYCNEIRLNTVKGFYSIEDWGVWSEGNISVFTIETHKHYPNGGKLKIILRPIINPNIKNDERIVLVDVDGKYKERIVFSSEQLSTVEMDFSKKVPGSKIVVTFNHLNPVKISDISGDDHRTVSLGFLSAELIPETLPDK